VVPDTGHIGPVTALEHADRDLETPARASSTCSIRWSITPAAMSWRASSVRVMLGLSSTEPEATCATSTPDGAYTTHTTPPGCDQIDVDWVVGETSAVALEFVPCGTARWPR